MATPPPTGRRAGSPGRGVALSLSGREGPSGDWRWADGRKGGENMRTLSYSVTQHALRAPEMRTFAVPGVSADTRTGRRRSLEGKHPQRTARGSSVPPLSCLSACHAANGAALSPQWPRPSRQAVSRPNAVPRLLWALMGEFTTPLGRAHPATHLTQPTPCSPGRRGGSRCPASP